MRKPIYLVGGVSREPLRHRVWGYFYRQEAAIAAAAMNEGDIYEAGWYPYALVTEVTEGIICIPDVQWWFEYAPETDTYKLIERPTWTLRYGWTGFPEERTSNESTVVTP